MALATFPANVNYKPDANGYRVLEPYRKPDWTEFEDGPALGRKKGGRRARIQYRLMFVKGSEAYLFRDFVETTLRNGTARFLMPVWREDLDVYTEKTVQIERGDVSIDPFGRGWSASFILIVYDW